MSFQVKCETNHMDEQGLCYYSLQHEYKVTLSGRTRLKEMPSMALLIYGQIKNAFPFDYRQHMCTN